MSARSIRCSLESQPNAKFVLIPPIHQRQLPQLCHGSRNHLAAQTLSPPLVVCLPKLNRNVPRASSALIPIAVSTCDGSTAPDEHAAPVEQANPFKSSAITSASPSIPSNVIFVVFGVRAPSAPFTRASATRESNPRSSSSLQPPTRSASASQRTPRNLRRLAQPNDPRHILRPRSKSALMMPAIHQLLNPRPAAHIQRPNPLRRIHLVPRNRKQIDLHSPQHQWEPSPPTAPHPYENKRPPPPQSSQSPPAAAPSPAHCSHASP